MKEVIAVGPAVLLKSLYLSGSITCSLFREEKCAMMGHDISAAQGVASFTSNCDKVDLLCFLPLSFVWAQRGMSLFQ